MLIEKAINKACHKAFYNVFCNGFHFSEPRLWRRCSMLLLVSSLALFSAQAQSAPSISDNPAIADFSVIKQAAASKASKPKSSNKLSSRLATLSLRTKGSTDSPNNSFFLRTRANAVQAYIELDNTDQTTLARLESYVDEIELVSKEMSTAQVWIDIDRLAGLAQQTWVTSIREPSYATTNRGSRTTQGDAILRSNILREQGITGRGIKVGIISDGALNWRDALASGDLPANFREFGQCTSATDGTRGCGGTGGSGSCNEGTAMAEIIHDIAPEAELAVAAVNTSLEFVSQANVLANTFGADIIVDDLGFFGEPYFEDGDIARGMNALPDDVLLVSAAGNSGGSHHEENFRLFFDSQNGLSFHNFTSGAVEDITHGFAVAPNGSTVILTQWNENFTAPNSDFDMFVLNQNNEVVASSQTEFGPAIEGVCVENDSSDFGIFFLVLVRFSGPGARLETFFLGDAGIEYPIERDAIFGHAGLARTLSVATINASEPGNDETAFYSSQGPSTVFRPRFEVRDKPDFAAIDGVNVTGAGGFPTTFFGTSAAAPHAAGIAALLMSAGPAVNADKVREAMRSTAVGGPNIRIGQGRLDAKAAFDALALGNVAPILFLLLDEE